MISNGTTLAGADIRNNSRLMRVFVGIVLAIFGISIMQLILATAMPTIVTQIGGEYLYGWVFSSYMLASLLTIPVFSKLADLYGKQRYYLAGLAVFAIGTLYGGLAANMEHLVVARIIQGLGAGLMIPTSLALISDLFPAEKRGNVIGLFSFVQILANLISPFLGSFITTQVGWHWIFFMTFVVMVAAMVLVASGRQRSQSSQSAHWSRVDILGGALFGIFCVLVVSFSNAVSMHSGLGLSASLLLVGTAVTGALLVWAESHHRDPVIKVSFFRRKILRRSILSSLVAGSIMYGVVTLLPLCSEMLKLQGFHFDGSRVLLVFMLAVTFGLLIASRLVTKLGTILPRALWGMSVLGAALMYHAVSANNATVLTLATGLLGLFLGGIMATILINSQNAVGSEDRTVLSGLVQLARYLGAAIGVTILTGILPEASQMSDATQFLGAFGLLLVMYVLGLVNELV